MGKLLKQIGDILYIITLIIIIVATFLLLYDLFGMLGIGADGS